jgi:hypothetical protein
MTNLKCPLKTKQHSCPADLLLSRLEHRYLTVLTVLVSSLCPLTLAFRFASTLFSGDRVDVAAMLCTCLRVTTYSPAVRGSPQILSNPYLLNFCNDILSCRYISALAKALIKVQNKTLDYLFRLLFLFSYFPSFVSFLQTLQLL